VSQIKGMDEKTPPPLPIFDKNKYKFPNFKKSQTPETPEISDTSGNIYIIVIIDNYFFFCF
jgi:hypothetical protein